MEIQVPSLLRIKPNALRKLGKYVVRRGHRNVALFWGVGVKDLFHSVTDVSFKTAEINVFYEQTVESNDIDKVFTVSKKLPHEIDAVVAIGGGKAIDFCKYLAFIKQLPFFAVPTLISNDAFASPTSSLTVDGHRKSVPTTVPDAVIIDTQIICDAPSRFLYSGIGDLFCKRTSVFDWKLAYKATGELVNDFAVTVALNAADTFTYYEHKDLKNMEYIGIIASSLLMTGIAMIIAGTSRPASGSEHLISHAYDKVAKNPSLHGLQVGVASYAVSHLQQVTFEKVRKDIVESGFAGFMKEHPLDREDFLKAVMIAPKIKKDYYTTLNATGNLEKLKTFIDKDELLRSMLK